MNYRKLDSRILLSGMDENAFTLAVANGLGYETAAFCWAPVLENEEIIERERKRLSQVKLKCFHAPFAELTPCAIDPLVREITRKRYLQSISLACSLGVNRIVIHGGFIPTVYFPEWFTEQSICFWKELLPELPGDILITLENVMETTPDLLVNVVSSVDDPRLRICLDIGHANANNGNLTAKDWIEPVLPWIAHAHIHNNNGIWDQHAPLGEGTADMDYILEKLSETDCTFTIENQDCRASLAWLKSHKWLGEKNDGN